MIRDGDMMLSLLLGSKTDVATRLTRNGITLWLQIPDQFQTTNICGYFHAATIISSLTICRRIILFMLSS